MSNPDTDIEAMGRGELIEEIKKLRRGIREHRDCSGHDLCWFHPALWSLLPEQVNIKPEVPNWPKFMEGCVKFRKSLDRELPDVPRTDEAP
jgi:hypothetical protein